MRVAWQRQQKKKNFTTTNTFSFSIIVSFIFGYIDIKIIIKRGRK